jgi:hypothetical protein
MLLDASTRSLRRVASAYLATGSFFVAFASFLAYGSTEGSAISRVFGWICGLGVVCFVLGVVAAQGKDRVRPWLRERLGSDDGWTTVPRRVGSEPSTGNQLIAIAALADEHGGQAVFRELDDGTIEVATKKGGLVERHAIDARGTTTSVEAMPTRAPLITKIAFGSAVAAFAAAVLLQGWLTVILFFVGLALALVSLGASNSAYWATTGRGRREDWHEVRTDEPGD